MIQISNKNSQKPKISNQTRQKAPTCVFSGGRRIQIKHQKPIKGLQSTNKFPLKQKIVQLEN